MRNLLLIVILLYLSSLLFSAPGDLLWKFQTGNEIWSSPRVSEGVVFVGSNDEYLYAINCSDGSLKWRYQTGTSIVYSSPCISNGVVYIGSCDNYLYAIETYGYKGFKNNKSASSLPSPSLSISPNPFSSRLSVSLPSSGAIYSLTGQLIMKLDKGKHSIDTNSWKEGVYIIKSKNSSLKITKL
ncbi:MAG: PQQ-binding-like beta-propeller repeat protein [Candidatus Coatesbacteria bacterium]|nr:PQQ-binding-like beta-propeller repeat protein [Candidatus Coatesbacteria bacterium]